MSDVHFNKKDLERISDAAFDKKTLPQEFITEWEKHLKYRPKKRSKRLVGDYSVLANFEKCMLNFFHSESLPLKLIVSLVEWTWRVGYDT